MSSSPSPAEGDRQHPISNDAEIHEEENGACRPAPAANDTCHGSTDETRHGNQMDGDGHPSTTTSFASTATTAGLSQDVNSDESSAVVSAQVEAGDQGEESGRIDLEAAGGGDGEHATQRAIDTDQRDSLQTHDHAQNESENEASKHRLRPTPLISKRTSAVASHSSMASCSHAVEQMLAPPPHRPRIKSIRDGAHAGHQSPRGSLSNAEAASANPGARAERGSGRSEVDGGADAGGEKVLAPVGGDHDAGPVPFAEVHAVALQLPGAVRVHPSSVIVAASTEAEDEVSPGVGRFETPINDNPSDVVHHRQDDEFDDATVARRESSTAIIEASLVTELALVEASPMDEEQLHALSSQAEVKAILTRQARKRRRLWIAIIILATLVVVLVVGVSVGVVAGVQEFSSPQNEDESYLRSILPNTTVMALEDPGSPQSQALRWVVADPYLLNLDADDEEKHYRLKQRFTLAVLFYAVSSGAPGQPTVGNWLVRDTNECEWHGCKCSEDQRIEELSVRDYDLVGYIPPEIGLLDQLASLDGGNTSLFGDLPTEIAALTRLSDFRVDHTRLSGTIPTELGLLTLLEVLFFQSSDITGTIPSELAALTFLRNLRIDDNMELNGTLPTELGQLTSLTSLSVKATIVGGTIPTEIGLLSNLEYLELHDTFIRGSVPEELCNLLGSATMNISVSCWLVSCDCGCACGADLLNGDYSNETLANDDSLLDDDKDDDA